MQREHYFRIHYFILFYANLKLKKSLNYIFLHDFACMHFYSCSFKLQEFILHGSRRKNNDMLAGIPVIPSSLKKKVTKMIFQETSSFPLNLVSYCLAEIDSFLEKKFIPFKACMLPHFLYWRWLYLTITGSVPGPTSLLLWPA